jgi:hypothetical protein
MDGLAISRGSNEGAGAVLSRGEFRDFSNDVLRVRAAEAEDQKKKQAVAAKLLQDNIQSNWASDNLNYFQPKMQQLRDETIEKFKKTNGKLSEIDVFEIQSKWNKLKNEADVSNNLYKEELERIKSIEEDPQGLKWDSEMSNMARNLYANPWQNDGTKKEIEAAGGIIPWRVQNQTRFGNVAAYDVEKDAQETFKDKLSTIYDRDAKGNIKWNDRGDFYEAKGWKMVDPEKFGEHYQTFWGRTNYKGKRFRKQTYDWVDRNIGITENGDLDLRSEAGKELAKRLPDTKGMTPDQIRDQLAYARGFEQAQAYTKSDELPLFRNKRDVTNNSFNFGGGNGGSGIGPVTTGSVNAVTGYNGAQINSKEFPRSTGAQFTTTPFKVFGNFSNEQVDPETGLPIQLIGNREITYGQFMVRPRLTRDAIVKQNNGVTVKLKAGHFLTDEQLKMAEKDERNKQIIRFDVYANGQYEDVSGLGKDKVIKSVTAPARVVYGTGLYSVADKEKGLYNQNYADLVKKAEEQNAKYGFYKDVNKAR